MAVTRLGSYCIIFSRLAFLVYACLCVHVYPPCGVSVLCVRYYAKDILDIISFIIIPNLQTRLLSLILHSQ